MSTNAPIGLDLWIDEEELRRISLAFDRIIVRSRRPTPAEIIEFFADYLEVE